MHARRHQKRWQTALYRFKDSIGWPAASLLVAAVVLGAGGVRYGLLNAIVQIFAFGLLVWFARDAFRNLGQYGKIFLGLLLATILVPILHLVPLPPAMWQGLPGRDLALETRELIGSADAWYPATLDFARTLVSAIGLIAPFAVIALFRPQVSHGETVQSVLRIIVGLALANFVLGGFQIATSGVSPFPYPILDEGRAYGFFANHNSSGLFFVVGLCALTGIKVREKGSAIAPFVKPGIGALLVFGTLLTQSRSSTALMALPLAYSAYLWLRPKLARGTAKQRLQYAGLGVIAAMGAAFLAFNTRFVRTIERFGDLETTRPSIWSDSQASIERFWPIGSGMGTFDEVFQIDESLETLVPPYAGRAHNDYLEIGIEAGLVGLVLVILWLIWASIAWFRSRASSSSYAVHSIGLALACIALQSAVDYPLRNQAFLCITAVLIAIFARTRPVK